MLNFRRAILFLLLLFVVAFPVSAQEGDPKTQLTKELWCPICNGIRLDVCEQKVCEQMREMIDTELASGKTTEEIKAEFIDLYGPVVLGEPPREGFSLIAWIAPILLLVGGIVAAVLLTRRWSRASKPMPVPASTAAASPGQTDEYMERVERELSDQ
ncbi:MAG: cytochrome c-type biogenesis protein CcmH [Caldilineales bacterium]|nr:cytochrome c-type biogenesis protein CcmH [Caldilineales bacterium]